MSNIIIMILIAVLIPLTFYWLLAIWMIGNLKKALIKVGLSERQFNEIATGKAEFKR